MRQRLGSDPPLSSEKRSLHLAAFAYLSDQWSFGVSIAANPRLVGRGMRNVAFATSITIHPPLGIL